MYYTLLWEQSEVLRSHFPPYQSLWHWGLFLSAIHVLFSQKKFELIITTPHLDRNILCIIQPKLTYRQKKVLSCLQLKCQVSCTWYKIIAKMLSLDIFAPLQQILNMIWRWFCECCSWLILHRCALYQIFYMIQRWLGECYLGYFCNAAGCNKYCVASANWKSPIHSPSKPKSKFYS